MRSTVSLETEFPRPLAERALVRVALLLLFAVATGSCLGWWSAHASLSVLPVLCPIRATTGIDCPGCGMGRALALLADGDILGSIRRHPFAVPVLLWLGAWALPLPPRARALMQSRSFASPPTVPITLTSALLAWWLARAFL